MLDPQPEPATAPAPPPRTRAQIAREKGARSRGPVTPEGKARSSRNAVKHGVYAAGNIVLDEEDEEAFERLREGLDASLLPRGREEAELIHRIAAAVWNRHRVEAMERALHQAYAHEPFGPMADEPGMRRLALMTRLKRDARTDHDRAVALLLRVQKERDGRETEVKARVRDAVDNARWEWDLDQDRASRAAAAKAQVEPAAATRNEPGAVPPTLGSTAAPADAVPRNEPGGNSPEVAWPLTKPTLVADRAMRPPEKTPAQRRREALERQDELAGGRSWR